MLLLKEHPLLFLLFNFLILRFDIYKACKTELPFIMHTLRKHKLIFNFDFCAVIKDCRAAHFAENLVRQHTHKLNIKRSLAVYNRIKFHFKSAV